jgi:membrane-bound lytic murein transglycosylase B
MSKGGREFALVVLVALAMPAWPQSAHYPGPAAAVRDDFSAYHQALELAADVALSEVWGQTGFSPQVAEVATNSNVQPDPARLHQFAQQYWNGNDKAVRRAIERVNGLRPMMSHILKAGGVPEEFIALILVESAGQPVALSHKGARGIWQFMPGTARQYGLTVNNETDDRLDVRKSTVAAARYLNDLHAQFGEWPLALAAYNAGAPLVRSAISTGRATDFTRLSDQGLLPLETREYVPAVFAAAALLGSQDGKESSGEPPDRGLSLLYAVSSGGGQP